MNITIIPEVVRMDLRTQNHELESIRTVIQKVKASITEYMNESTLSGAAFYAHKSHLHQGHMPFLEQMEHCLSTWLSANHTHMRALNNLPEQSYNRGIILAQIDTLPGMIQWRTDRINMGEVEWIPSRDRYHEQLQLWRRRRADFDHYLNTTRNIYEAVESKMNNVKRNLLRIEYMRQCNTTGALLLPSAREMLEIKRKHGVDPDLETLITAFRDGENWDIAMIQAILQRNIRDISQVEFLAIAYVLFVIDCGDAFTQIMMPLIEQVGIVEFADTSGGMFTPPEIHMNRHFMKWNLNPKKMTELIHGMEVWSQIIAIEQYSIQHDCLSRRNTLLVQQNMLIHRLTALRSLGRASTEGAIRSASDAELPDFSISFVDSNIQLRLSASYSFRGENNETMWAHLAKKMITIQPTRLGLGVSDSVIKNITSFFHPGTPPALWEIALSHVPGVAFEEATAAFAGAMINTKLCVSTLIFLADGIMSEYKESIRQNEIQTANLIETTNAIQVTNLATFLNLHGTVETSEIHGSSRDVLEQVIHLHPSYETSGILDILNANIRDRGISLHQDIESIQIEHIQQNPNRIFQIINEHGLY